MMRIQKILVGNPVASINDINTILMSQFAQERFDLTPLQWGVKTPEFAPLRSWLPQNWK